MMLRISARRSLMTAWPLAFSLAVFGLVLIGGPQKTFAAGQSGELRLAQEHGAPAEGHGEAAVAEEHGTEHGDEAHGEGEHEGGSHCASEVKVPVWAILPFAGILLSIAILPLVAAHFWHHKFPQVSLFWGAIGILNYYMLWKVYPCFLIHTGVEYLSFIALLGSLFVVSGGILIKGSIQGKPATNAAIILIGSIIASLIGTTGASMLLIRPLLRANANRKHKVHTIIFFIFLVSNIGGSLTPLGDPPLFLGFLKGVPFAWTLTNLAVEWATAVGVLLVIYFALDTMMVKKEDKSALESKSSEPIRLVGNHNFIFLAGILGTVILYSKLPADWGFMKDAVQIGLMSLMAVLSMVTTKKDVREENGFTWFPIKEVAILFASIFLTMIPALQLLAQKGPTMGVTQPYQFFWFTGALSSFLDNAPTYLTFLSLATSLPIEAGHSVVTLLDGTSVTEAILKGISVGAVFMGANTYIGNGPNFMVKSVAEESGVQMPSFFGYMAWSVGILIPLFIAMTFVFFMH